MSQPNRIARYAEFWLFYLREHSRPATRRLHFIGTGLGLAAGAVSIASGSWWRLLSIPVLAYGFAWISHFFVERNRPATFTYPVWSLISDFRMLGLMAVGRLGPELRKAGVLGAAADSSTAPRAL